EIGSHTLSHPILSRCDPARQKLEIEESLRLLRTQLGRDITSFAYPNGRLCDIDSNSIDLVRAAGYASAVTCEGVFVRAGADPHLLSRIGAAHSVAGLSRQLDGVSYFSSRLQRRLAIGRGAH
ncbi:MAG TPA: polysaccharide deacetylase family protein, partial [Steroidobacteraceae bacterium]|nr:polysaccharide deacetylase family protein [Steroidobacteraceae bacterium]